MSIEVRPVGVTCNLRCAYCYEEPVRTKTPTLRYDRVAVLAAIDKAEHNWSLFGGEALLLNLVDLEELLQVSYNKWKRSGVQTNGTLITPKHIELFEKYKTHVGISLDGPEELNDSRWAGTLEATRKATEKTFQAIDMLLTRARETNNKSLIPSLIITLHGKNTTIEAWPRMKAWLCDMDARGVSNINFHTMELDAEATKDSEWYVPHDRMKEVMLDLWDLSTTWVNASAVNFKEIVDLLRSEDKNTMCVWHACDPWNTSAVQGLEGDGSPSHCTRTNKDGVDWMPAEGFGEPAKWQIGDFPLTNRSHERQLSLYVTPQEHGGCQGCRFWSLCMGHCPGTSEESVDGQYGDWRLRTTYCQTWKDMFEEGERRLLEIGETPFTHSPLLPQVEQIMYKGWIHGKNIALSTAKNILEGKISFDTVMSQGYLASGHGDHTDGQSRGHGDLHGDHYDQALGNQINQPHGDHTDVIPHGDHVDANEIDSTKYTDSTEIVPHGDHTDVIPHGDHTDDVIVTDSPVVNQPHGDEHSDHVDANILVANRPHGDGHGDEHGDHLDEASKRRRTKGQTYTTSDGKQVNLW